MRVKARRLHHYVASFGAWPGLRLWLREMIRSAEAPERVHSPHLGVVTTVRLNTSDIDVYYQIFVTDEYRLPDGIRPPRTVIDAGGNAGYAALYFAHTYPDASKIVCIEPEASNFAVLAANTAAFAAIVPLQAALTGVSGYFEVVDHGWGKWAFQVGSSPTASTSPDAIRGMTVAEVMREEGMETVDLLKVDIEGGEKEVFEADTAWLASVDVMAVELHDRMKPGCSRAFFSKLKDFPNELHRGETIYAWRSSATPSPAAVAELQIAGA